MPIYEFHCKECRDEFKALRRWEQLDTVTCPACGTGRVARLLSVTARNGTDAALTEPCCAPAMGGCCGMNPMGCSRGN